MGHPGQQNEFRVERLTQNEKQVLGNGSMGKRAFWANTKDLNLGPQNLTKSLSTWPGEIISAVKLNIKS